MQDDIEQLTAIANEMQPHVDRWVKKHGALALVKVLAIFINQVAEEQPDPDKAIREYVGLLEHTRRAFKEELREKTGPS